METRLVTPGHSPPLDTLIALGLANGVLQACPTASLLVRKRGVCYEIRIKGQVNWEEVHAKLSDAIMFEARRLRFGMGDLLRAFGPQRGIKFEELEGRFLDLTKKAYNHMLEVEKEYSQEAQHAASEGRVKGRRGRTAYLPIAPWAGKFFAGTYKYQKRQYTLCPLCSFLAWAGILTSSSLIKYRKRDKRGTIYVVPDPIHMEGYDLALLSLLFREKRTYIPEDLPLLAIPLLVLSTGETIWPVEGEYGLYVWKYEQVGNFPGIRGYSQQPLRPLLEFVAKAKSRGGRLARLVRVLSQRDPAALAQIVECLSYGEPDPYTVVRSVWTSLNQEERRTELLKLLERSFAEALYEVWRSYWGS
uniref:Uncharacterized protein n=1 Tax=Thermofilum pendens TaxID=2269 RepID=A0A7C1T5I7_THEPE